MYGYAEQFAHLAQRPQQKFPNYFCLFFCRFAGLAIFYFGQSHVLRNFIIAARMRRMRHSCAIIASPQKFYLRKFYFNLFSFPPACHSLHLFFASSLHLLCLYEF